ncbi:MAG: acetyl-CoA decarbonylase/synthase complex subunit delta [Coriobacteriaceae bacterium]|nr:acetyl-CoA decarbonylase/synthase complex subunit delta [Coriobacteriaceae bacterium]
MSYEAPVERPSGRILTETLGSGDGAVSVGGESALPFYLFDGEMPNRPVIAMEVFDAEPQGWPAAVTDALGDVLADPAAWARACAETHGADLVCVQLASTDPNGADTSPEDAAACVRSVVDAVNVPVIVYGSGNADKDAEVLKKVAEVVSDTPLAIGPAVEDNYKAVTAAALGYGHTVIAETPIDVNMAKQLNILITQMGLPAERILIDPSTGSIGYGIEYGYTVMERLRLAALGQNDAMTQMPMIVNLGKEAWRTKEARATQDEEPAWGDGAKRGVLWEACTAITMALAGADVLVMRHPEAVRLVRTAIDGLLEQ